MIKDNYYKIYLKILVINEINFDDYNIIIIRI